MINLDLPLRQNYEPISKLPAMAKFITSKFQSGFHSLQSTKTAHLRVLSDILIHGYAGKCSILVVSDLSAAFEAVDHNIPMGEYLWVNPTVPLIVNMPPHLHLSCAVCHRVLFWVPWTHNKVF